MHECSLSEEIAREVARHMAPGYVAAARRLVILRRPEWSGRIGHGLSAEDPIRCVCPECGVAQGESHSPGCELGQEVVP